MSFNAIPRGEGRAHLRKLLAHMRNAQSATDKARIAKELQQLRDKEIDRRYPGIAKAMAKRFGERKIR